MKKSWDLALGPIKQVPMNLLIMYMSGNSISIFPIMMVGMMLIRPIKALFSTGATFKVIEGTQVAGQKFVFFLGNLLNMGLALYKCHSMGLLPTHASDWLAFAEPQSRLEFSDGGMSLVQWVPDKPYTQSLSYHYNWYNMPLNVSIAKIYESNSRDFKPENCLIYLPSDDSSSMGIRRMLEHTHKTGSQGYWLTFSSAVQCIHWSYPRAFRAHLHGAPRSFGRCRCHSRLLRQMSAKNRFRNHYAIRRMVHLLHWTILHICLFCKTYQKFQHIGDYSSCSHLEKNTKSQKKSYQIRQRHEVWRGTDRTAFQTHSI